MPATIQPAVVGATGYAGFELARLLFRHPRVKKPVLLTRDGDGPATSGFDKLYQDISGNGGLPLEPFSWATIAAKGVNVLFLATPHEVSREWVPEAVRQGVHVIDLSGAWRLACSASRAVYQFHDQDPALADHLHAPDVYGIPDLSSYSIKQAKREWRH